MDILLFASELPRLLEFFRAAGLSLVFQRESLLIAQRRLDAEFRLQTYGILVDQAFETLALDLIAHRSAGAIALYPWDSTRTQGSMEEFADWLEQHYPVPLILAAYSIAGDPLPSFLSTAGLELNRRTRLTGVDLQSSTSVWRAIEALLQLAIENAPD